MSERKTHPKDLPFMVVVADSAVNPPSCVFVEKEKEAIACASEHAFKYQRRYQVFKLTLVAHADPQPAKVVKP